MRNRNCDVFERDLVEMQMSGKQGKQTKSEANGTDGENSGVVLVFYDNVSHDQLAKHAAVDLSDRDISNKHPLELLIDAVSNDSSSCVGVYEHHERAGRNDEHDSNCADESK
jgi:hypothetical protein